MAETIHGEHGFTLEEVRQFHRDGYYGPFRVCPHDEVSEYVERIREEVLSSENPLDGQKGPQRDRHRDSPAVYDLLSRAEIVDKIRSLYGDDALLWGSQIFEKAPGDLAVPWHQDDHFHALEPSNNVSAWIALNRVDRENGCMQIIPGSHEEVVPHVEAPEDVLDDEMVDPEHVDDDDAITMEMEPGECFIFNEHLVHRSFENVSDRPRVAMTARYTFPFVNIDRSHERLYEDHALVPVSGSDWLGLNPTIDPPSN